MIPKLQSIPCTNVVVTEAAVVTCNDPTPNFASGCDLLLHYDADGDGVISVTELAQANIHASMGTISGEEATFVSNAHNAGSINAICPGCYIEPAVTCNDPTMHFASGCDLLLHYDTDDNGMITDATSGNDEAYRAYIDHENGTISDAEYKFIVDTIQYHQFTINNRCPGCYIEQLPNIVATNITVTPSSCEEPCDISISITWENTGNVCGTFTPGYTINGTLYQDTPVTLDPGQSFSVVYTVSDVSSGNYVICPEPNP